MRLCFDLECDGFNPTQIFTLVAKDIDNDTVYTYTPQNIRQSTVLLSQASELIGHNIIRFDIPVLKKILGWEPGSNQKLTDTLVYSRLYNPSLDGGHSLRAWGERLRFPKGDHCDFTQYTPDMLEYNKQDVEVTHALYTKLTNLLAPYGNESIDLEMQVQTIISKQIDNGWLLDQNKSYDLLAELQERKIELEDMVRDRFKPLPVFVKEVVPKVKKDGTFSTVGLKFLGDDWGQVSGQFSRIEWPEFNLGSRQQIARYLQWFGWEPDKTTDKGSVIVDESVLIDVDIPEAKLIAEYLLVTKRIAQVNSWVDSVAEDGRVHGDVNPIGAVTGRMTHSSPNMAQVPASYSPYGEQCRSCWVVPKGYKLVGCDASGLELRMLAHYMNDPEYTRVLLDEDIHTRNQLSAGLATRDQAKTFIYAFLYGAGDSKIGSIVGGTARHGKRLKERFLANTPALGELRSRVEQASARGYLKGLDGRRLWIRSPHAALNTLLQSAGAIIMKKALAIFVDYAMQWRLEVKLIGNIHDEVQMEVLENQADKAGYLFRECIKAAGAYYKLNCPLDGDFKVGNNWAETH